VNCTGKQSIGTVCSFNVATADYTSLGSLFTHCINNGSNYGIYNNPIPVLLSKCSAVPVLPSGLATNCTGTQSIGESCEFTVDYSNYDSIGLLYAHCVNNGSNHGIYDNPIPELLTKCPSFPILPDGLTVNCTGKQSIGTVCSFNVNSADYTSSGSLFTHCINNGSNHGIYNHPFPTLFAKCVPLPGLPAGLSVNCTGKQSIGSVCSYDVDNLNYDSVGELFTHCVNNGSNHGIYNHPIPTLIAKCPALTGLLPSGLAVNCSGKVSIHQSCQFTVDTVHYTSQGSLITHCVNNGSNHGVYSGSIYRSESPS
jgi:hypothetical protein